jgi:hypothetical protein
MRCFSYCNTWVLTESSNVPFLYLLQARSYLKITSVFGLMARASSLYNRSWKRLRAGKSKAWQHFPTDLSEQSVDSRFHSSDYEDFSLEEEETPGAPDAVGCVGSECNNVCRRFWWRQQNLLKHMGTPKAWRHISKTTKLNGEVNRNTRFVCTVIRIICLVVELKWY